MNNKYRNRMNTKGEIVDSDFSREEIELWFGMVKEIGNMNRYTKDPF